MFVCANTTEPLSDIGSSHCFATHRMLLRVCEREGGRERKRGRERDVIAKSAITLRRRMEREISIFPFVEKTNAQKSLLTFFEDLETQIRMWGGTQTIDQQFDMSTLNHYTDVNKMKNE